MALHTVRRNIDYYKCDAVVNTVDGQIYPYNGDNLATFDKKIVIHTASPSWECPNSDKVKELKNYYTQVLHKAVEGGANSIALPLIYYGYPKRIVYHTAAKAITQFLRKKDIEVYLYVGNIKGCAFYTNIYNRAIVYVNRNYEPVYHMCQSFMTPDWLLDSWRTDIQKAIINSKDNFVVTLLKLIDMKGMTDVECYKGANVSKQTWYNIMNHKKYKPNKKTAISFAISLKLTVAETNDLLEKAGYTLSKSIKFDVIVQYCIENKIYDIDKVNEILFDFGEECLD